MFNFQFIRIDKIHQLPDSREQCEFRISRRAALLVEVVQKLPVIHHVADRFGQVIAEQAQKAFVFRSQHGIPVDTRQDHGIKNSEIEIVSLHEPVYDEAAFVQIERHALHEFVDVVGIDLVLGNDENAGIGKGERHVFVEFMVRGSSKIGKKQMLAFNVSPAFPFGRTRRNVSC